MRGVCIFLCLILCLSVPAQTTDPHAALLRGKQLWRTDPDSALEIFSRGLVLSRDISNDSLTAAYMSEMARTHSMNGDGQQALAIYHQILRDYWASDLHEITLNALMGIGFEHKNGGKIDSALEYSLRGLTYRDDHQLISSSPIEALIGELYIQLNNFDQAEIYMRRNLENSADALPVFRMVALHYMARMFLDSERPDSFLKYQAELVRYADEHDIKPSGNVYHFELFFRKPTGEYDEETITDMLESADDDYRHFLPLGNALLARIALDKKAYRKALVHAIAAIDEESSDKFLLEYHNLKAQALEGLGRHKEALEATQTVNLLTARIYEDDSRKRIDELQVKFDTERKEKEILRQQTEIQEAKDQRMQLILVIIALTAIAGLIIFWLKQRMARKELRAQQKSLLDQQRITDLEQEQKIISLGAMIKGQEAERSRIAQDLHDGLGGVMATIKTHVEFIQTKVQQNGEMPAFAKANALINHACEEVSRISRNMMPKALGENGLAPAIEDLVLATGDPHRLQIETDLRGLNERLDETTEIMIYRIVQEAMTNAIKHAQATHLLIQCLQKDQQLYLLIEDDGKGFEAEEAQSKGGLGLDGIRSRVEFLNGSCEIDSRPGVGTSISIQIPINA